MTSISPFQPHIELSPRQQRTLALAGVFQAAQLAHFIAYGESVQLSSHIAYPFMISSIKASLSIQPIAIKNQNPLLYFHQIKKLNLGLQALECAISQPFNPKFKISLPKIQQPNFPMNYAFLLTQLAKKIYKTREFQLRIQQTQQHIIRQLSFFNYDYTHASIMGNLAQCYKDTASSIQPHILIKGKIDILQNSLHADRIRAILMAGLQSAHLWRELGGTTWQFLFSKRHLLQDTRSLLKLNYQQQNLIIKD